jgi:energy-coupling factor transporter ATP-binding protein EcfA2
VDSNESFLYNRKLMAELSGRPLLDNALDEHLFVGRAELVDQALRAVRQGVNVLLLGPRGSGKTSTLHRLAHLLRQRKVVTVLIDGRAAEDTGDLLGLLAWRLGVTEPTRPPPGETERLLALLESVGGRLRDAGKGTVVALIDELASPTDAHRLFGRLRDDLWRLPITWVVSVDETDRAAYLKPPADAFFARVLALEPLDDEASRALLRQRVPELEEGTTAMLAPQGGGNPRSLIRLAQQVLLDEVDPAELVGASLRHDQALGRVGEPARRLYDEVVASGAVSMSEPGLLRRLGWTRPRAQQVIATLLSAGLVEAAIEPASRGRPRKVYRAILDGPSPPPREVGAGVT